MEAQTWRALSLEKGLLYRLHETILDVAQEFGSAEPARVVVDASGAVQGQTAPDCSLGTGDAGIALFLAYFERAFPHVILERSSGTYIARAMDGMVESNLGLNLHSGLLGPAWVANHLASMQPELFAEDPCVEIDELLFGLLEPSAYDGPFDLIHGLVGVGVYALSRLPRPRAARAVERVVSLLRHTGETRADGVTWYTPSGRMPERRRDTYPVGHYDLGAGFGVPGVIAFLALAFRARIAEGETGRLLSQALDWFLRQRLPGVAPAFPVLLGPDGDYGDGRNSWCYGDAGVAACLRTAAVSAGDAFPQLIEIAQDVAEAALIQPLKPHLLVRDSGIIHGAAGLAHIFNRAHQSNKDERFRHATIDWLMAVLNMREGGLGVRGYRGVSYYQKGKLRWKNPEGFIGGACGIALVFLSVAFPLEPAWDRVLLCS